MKKVVITGADGFVGSYTVKEFLNNGYFVLAIDLSIEPKRLDNHKNLKYLHCDLFNEDLLEKIPDNDYDLFLHFAWAGSAGDARTDYNLQMKNATNTVECMKIAKKIGCTRFIGAGSIMEYEIESSIHKQGTRPGLGYIYGIAKYTAHALCKSVASEIDIDLIWPIITNAYGIGEISPRFVNSTLRKILNEEPLQFTSALQNYDFVYVTDVARAFYQISKNGKPFCEYVIGSSKARPLKEFIIEMQQECAPHITANFGDIPYTGINIPLDIFHTNNTEIDCGFKASISFAEGTKKTLEWLKEMKT